MAIVKFNNRKNSTSAEKRNNRLKRAIEYITDPNKTCDELTGGIGVNGKNALERMNIIKKYYNKCGGREYVHFVVSFKGRQDVNVVYNIGKKICEIYYEYQVLFAVHVNTKNTHIHFIVNTVSVFDGHKLSQSINELDGVRGGVELIIMNVGLRCCMSCVGEIFSEYQPRELIQPMTFYKRTELIEPMVFYGADNSELTEPMIFYKETELTEPMVFYDQSDLR